MAVRVVLRMFVLPSAMEAVRPLTPPKTPPHLAWLNYRRNMCRSIKTLRPPYVDDLSEDDVRAAALQYVRKVSGFRAPAAHNAEAFDHAVDTITAATQELLDSLQVRGGRAAG